jgi:hypothetical protein
MEQQPEHPSNPQPGFWNNRTATGTRNNIINRATGATGNKVAVTNNGATAQRTENNTVKW